ncbi:MAG: DUF6265 family protein [Hyphomonadaceae bacterium]|nr:DUF6265 family protein [Hyphomonadaceae bacterium]
MLRSLLLLMVSALAAACAAGPTPLPIPDPEEVVEDVLPLAWLEGCWITEDGSYREVWQRGGKNLLFGFATMSQDGEVVFFEQTRIELETPAFYAYPAGVGPSPFPMVSMSEGEVVFLNPAHDYPQRIRYARESDALVAVISLADETRQNSWHFAHCSESTF